MVIDVEEVSLDKKGIKILDSVSLQCGKGEICGITGRNGSGKTMLMKCICGFVKPTHGRIKVLGKYIGTDRDFIPDAGIIIETPGFIPYYSGYKNLKLLAGIKGKASVQDIKHAMEITGLKPDLKRSVQKYSLGMRQRLGLAQAIMENPMILILDEPFNGLDKKGVMDMRKLFLHMKDCGKTIMLASHSAEDIEILCDKVYEIEHGILEQKI